MRCVACESDIDGTDGTNGTDGTGGAYAVATCSVCGPSPMHASCAAAHAAKSMHEPVPCPRAACGGHVVGVRSIEAPCSRARRKCRRLAAMALTRQISTLSFAHSKRPTSLKMCDDWVGTGVCAKVGCARCHSTTDLARREAVWKNKLVVTPCAPPADRVPSPEEYMTEYRARHVDAVSRRLRRLQSLLGSPLPVGATACDVEDSDLARMCAYMGISLAL
jgi:hypothetical protein